MNDGELVLLAECLRHFVHRDESEAAIALTSVRYSPITRRLAASLAARGHETKVVRHVLDGRSAWRGEHHT